MTTNDPHDLAIRFAAFKWLSDQGNIHGDVLPRPLLQKGFEFEGNRVPLVAPQDSFGPDGLLAYKYRGTDPSHPDNHGLRRTMSQQLPLVYLHGIVPGKYLALWPVYVVGDDSAALTFRIAVDDAAYIARPTKGNSDDDITIARRSYVIATTRVRLHQRSFRERVIAEYRSQCSLCRLRHDELLDAAHIIPDSCPEGEPPFLTALHCVSSTMPRLTVSLSALLQITQYTSGAMYLRKQTVRSSDMAYSKCMGAGCFCFNPKNSGRIVTRLSGSSSASRQRREQIGFHKRQRGM